MTVYYNELAPFPAQWLRNLIEAGHLPAGDVDERDIRDVRPDDLAGYRHAHFFAGIGGWARAVQLAGWPSDRELWTASCPCQPYSLAGQGEGAADPRDLWPAFAALARERRPGAIAGEQVTAAVRLGWIDRVYDDLGAIDYACWAASIPACAVGAPHRRERLWFVADALSSGNGEIAGCLREDAAEHGGRSAQQRLESASRGGALGDAATPGSPVGPGGSGGSRIELPAAVGAGRGGPWDDFEWLACADGKARRVKPGLRLLAARIPGRVGGLQAYGNALVPSLAAEILKAWMECRP